MNNLKRHANKETVEPEMEHNVCHTCEAKDGRAGMTINGNCKNCHETMKTGNYCVFTYLPRTDEELKLMADKLLGEKQ